MFSEFMRAIDHELCNNLTFSTLGSEYDKYGSNAKIETYATIMELSIINDAKQIEDVINTQVIKPLIDINFGVQEVYPYIKFTVKKDKDIKAFMEAVKIAVELDANISEKYIRDYCNIPDPQAGEELLKMVEPKEKNDINNQEKTNDKEVDNNVQEQETETNNEE
jgi:phage gp29-like protein